MMPPSVDRLRMPLQLVIAAAATAIVRSLMFAFVATLVRTSGSYALYRYMSPLQLLLSVVIGGLLIGASVSIVSQKRPGHPLAIATAIASGVGILLGVANSVRGGMSPAVPLLYSVVTSGALILLAMCLRSIGKSRERPVDSFAFSVVGLASLALLLGVAARLGLRLGEPGRYLSLLIALAEYGALIATAVSIMSHVPAAELALGDPSAYRGPQGAYPIDAVAPPGSVALGFLAGFFGGCIGLGLVLMLAKGAATKRGAGIGFACQTVVGIGLRAAAH